MNEENKLLKTKNSNLEELVFRQEKRIQEMDEKILSQEIIINALVSQVKNKTLLEKKDSNNQTEIIKRPCVADEPTKKLDNNIVNTEVINDKTDSSEYSKYHQNMVKEIKNIFMYKQKTAEFKMNFTFKKFIEYAESYYEFLLTNKKISKLKNPFKLYIDSNLEKIIKCLIENINNFNLNQICSSIFMINSAIEYNHKLVIAHDILLEIKDYSKLLYIYSALFNNIELGKDLISVLITKILYHQYCIDSDLYEDDTIFGYLELIKNNFGLEKPKKTLWKSLSDFLIPIDFFTTVQGTIQINNSAIEAGFGLRMLCTYLDWDYTYNEFIINKLLPAVKDELNATYLYYLGILAINSLRMFGKTESVTVILNELLEWLNDTDEINLVAFLILKQVFNDKPYKWLETQKEMLKKKDIPIDSLESILLI